MSAASRLLHADRTALVLVDLQEKLLPAVSGSESLLANVRKLVQAAETLGLPIMATTQYQERLGSTVPGVLPDGVSATDKSCFSCFAADGFPQRLADAIAPPGAVLLAGVETHICVMQTALDGLAGGYDVHVIADASGARAPANHQAGLERLRSAGCVISSAEMAIYELLMRADRQEFKQLLPILK